MDILAKAVGRRKEAVAQVQILRGTGQFIINNKPAQEYLQNDSCSLISVKAPFDILLLSTTKSNDPNSISTESQLKIDTIVKVKGGGLMGQAEAIRLGIARAVCLLGTGNVLSTSPLGVASQAGGSNETGDNSNDSNFENNLLNDSSDNKILDVRKQLKDKGYLTQDSRVKERRKYGLKKARKASQYHKR